jgi:hypothetical protein
LEGCKSIIIIRKLEGDVGNGSQNVDPPFFLLGMKINLMVFELIWELRRTATPSTTTLIDCFQLVRITQGPGSNGL